MPPRTTVSVCIPTYNQAHFLAQAVASAFNQTYAPAEVWVSDDGSTDETPAILDRLHQQHPALRSYRSEINRGIAANVVSLLQQQRCDFIVRLDSDDLLAPRYIERLASLLTDRPGAGYAHCAIQEINAKGQPIRVRRLARVSHYETADQSLRASVTGYRVCANVLMFRREALRSEE